MPDFFGGDLKFLGETSFFWITGEVIQLGFLSSYPRILDHHVYPLPRKVGMFFSTSRGMKWVFMLKRGFFDSKKSAGHFFGKKKGRFFVLVHNLRLMELVWMICFKCWMLYLGSFFLVGGRPSERGDYVVVVSEMFVHFFQQPHVKLGVGGLQDAS